MYRTSWAPWLVGGAARVRLFLRFPTWSLHGRYMVATWSLHGRYTGNSHNSTSTQRKEANEGALESSCRAANGLIAGWVRGGGLVEQL